MGKLAMVADGHAHVLAKEPHYGKYDDRRPMDIEQSRYSTQMKCRNHDEKNPVEIRRLSLYHFDYAGIGRQHRSD